MRMGQCMYTEVNTRGTRNKDYRQAKLGLAALVIFVHVC